MRAVRPAFPVRDFAHATGSGISVSPTNSPSVARGSTQGVQASCGSDAADLREGSERVSRNRARWSYDGRSSLKRSTAKEDHAYSWFDG